MNDLGPVHHIVMYWAVDGGPIFGAVNGLAEGIASGESFVVFEPQPLEAVREATVEVVDLGYARLRCERPSKTRGYSKEDALAVLRDPATWSGEEYYALSVTDEGIAVWRALDDQYGDAARKAHEVASRRSEEFRQRHPDFEDRRTKYFEAMERWADTGEGEMPEFPRYPNEPPPADDDVPRNERPED